MSVSDETGAIHDHFAFSMWHAERSVPEMVHLDDWISPHVTISLLVTSMDKMLPLWASSVCCTRKSRGSASSTWCKQNGEGVLVRKKRNIGQRHTCFMLKYWSILLVYDFQISRKKRFQDLCHVFIQKKRCTNMDDKHKVDTKSRKNIHTELQRQVHARTRPSVLPMQK